MIYVNGERVKLNGDSQYAKEFQKKKPEIEAVGWPVKLRIVPTWVTGTKASDGQWVQNVPPQFINFVATEFSEDEGSVEWRYSPTPARKKGDELIFPTRGERFFENNKRVMSFNKDQIDLLFFLIYKSSHKGRIFEVVDERGEAENRVSIKRKQAKLTEALYGTSSPLTGNFNMIKTVAQSWGIPNVERSTESLLLDNLERAVMEGQKMKDKGKNVRGIDEFIKDISMDELTKIRAVVQEAIDANVIAFNENTHNYGWFFLDGEGKWSTKIQTMSPRSYDIRQQKLAEYLLHNKSVLNMIKAEIGHEEEPDDLDPSKIREMKWEDIKKKGKELNIPVVGRPKEEVYRDFEKRYGVK